jgi:hypothetical protein
LIVGAGVAIGCFTGIESKAATPQKSSRDQSAIG